MSKSNFVTLDLTTPANLGQAMGRHKGQVIFVPGGLPGERVRVRLSEQRKRWARGELVDILRASPDRVEPPCPYFGVCGGCSMQHLDSRAQLAIKQRVLEDVCRREQITAEELERIRAECGLQAQKETAGAKES